MRDFKHFLLRGETRNMDTISLDDGGYLAPEQFRYQLGVALKKYDAIFDSDVSTLYEPESGYKVSLPAADDTGSSIGCCDSRRTNLATASPYAGRDAGYCTELSKRSRLRVH